MHALEQPCAAKRPGIAAKIFVVITGLFAAQGCSYTGFMA